MPKNVTDIRSLRSIRSMHTTRRRSIPKSKSSAYLNLYMLRKEKERLEKEKETAEKRIAGIDKRVTDIQKEMNELQRLTEQEKTKRAPFHTETGRVSKESVIEDKKWKKMALNY